MGWLIDLLPLPYTDAVVVLGAAVLGVAAGVLGALAVLPGRSLVGDALAHSALPGVAIAFLATGAKDPASLLAGAAIAGLVGALMMVGIERSSRIRPDAAIGVVLSSFFSLGIVLLTYISGTGDAQQAGLESYLFGQAAGLLERDVAVMAAVAAAAIACVAIALRPLKTALFDREFAAAAGLPVRVLELATTALLVVAIVLGLRAVGAILMVAMLIVPTVAARQLTSRLAVLLPLAGLIGAGVGVTGALLSSRAEVPTGPVIVLTGTAVVLAAVLLAPARGVVWRAARRRREGRAARVSGVLVDLETALHAGPPPTPAELAMAGARPPREVRRGVRDLDRAGMIERDGDRLRLSERGAAAAHRLLDERRLWSAWLEHGWRLDPGDAREPDPRDLRGSLGDELTDRLIAMAEGRA
ncbi:iron chelate uptake ABC transporter family permease subunit [Miltoncostaea marina]|uniref:metal ABC transporter permease n=1 Tax=Miltoncostaea marina TaxID=2843215 RepID=UPI001C3D78E2|nr:iron chelate uptake ABC transporter family permease subunit [Miltoncostaea marina]